MSKVLLIIFLFLSFPITTYSWETVPVPDYVDKKTKSPWNFYDDFEDQEIGQFKLKNRYDINDKGAGKKPFKIKQDDDGNKFLEITVKHGWNKCCGSWISTERSEIETKIKKSTEKELWYGFKMRIPKEFKHIDDRFTITQFKNQFYPMKRSPLLHINFLQEGKILDIGGDTGGVASKIWNDESFRKYAIRSNYYEKDNNWMILEKKERGFDYNYYWKCNVSKSNIAAKLPSYCNSKNLQNIDKVFKVNRIEEWNTFKIGIKNSKKKDGFVKVYINNQLMMNYEGVTFDWKGNYIGSIVRIGIYRDSDPNKIGYHDQIIHYDDFAVVSDKKTLDKYLN